MLHDFDMFTTHSRQALLYNLMDLIHSASVRLSVVGITTRLDAAHLLEKRVRSRFSQNCIHFRGCTNLVDGMSIMKDILLPVDVAGRFEAAFHERVKVRRCMWERSCFWSPDCTCPVAVGSSYLQELGANPPGPFI